MTRSTTTTTSRRTAPALVAVVLALLLAAPAPAAVPTAAAVVAAPVVVGPAVVAPAVVAPAATSAADPPPVHVVRPGDGLNALARRYRLSPLQLVLWNDLRSPFTLHPDGVLRLGPPTSGRRPGFTATVAPVTAAELGSSYQPGCPVAPASLRSVTLTRTTPDGSWGTGELVVHADLVAATVGAFEQLYTQRVPVALMVPVTAFGSSDDRSMAANNTSAFNCRRSTGGTRWSEHSFGRAIDVNPVQNPYMSGRTVLPPAGAAHTDRSRWTPGMLHSGGGVAAFTSRGLAWGGSWLSSKDYQHFSSTGR